MVIFIYRNQVYNQNCILLSARILNFLLYYFLFYLKSLAASTLAGESKLGSASIELTLIMTAYIVKIGFHFSYNFY